MTDAIPLADAPQSRRNPYAPSRLRGSLRGQHGAYLAATRGGIGEHASVAAYRRHVVEVEYNGNEVRALLDWFEDDDPAQRLVNRGRESFDDGAPVGALDAALPGACVIVLADDDATEVLYFKTPRGRWRPCDAPAYSASADRSSETLAPRVLAARGLGR